MNVRSVTLTLRSALRQLEGEKEHIDRQIAAIRSALSESSDGRARVTRGVPAQPKTKHRRMSTAARRAASQRMKAYWAKRKAASAKVKSKGAQQS